MRTPKLDTSKIANNRKDPGNTEPREKKDNHSSVGDFKQDFRSEQHAEETVNEWLKSAKKSSTSPYGGLVGNKNAFFTNNKSSLQDDTQSDAKRLTPVLNQSQSPTFRREINLKA